MLITITIDSRGVSGDVYQSAQKVGWGGEHGFQCQVYMHNYNIVIQDPVCKILLDKGCHWRIS